MTIRDLQRIVLSSEDDSENSPAMNQLKERLRNKRFGGLVILPNIHDTIYFQMVIVALIILSDYLKRMGKRKDFLSINVQFTRPCLFLHS